MSDEKQFPENPPEDVTQAEPAAPTETESEAPDAELEMPTAEIEEMPAEEEELAVSEPAASVFIGVEQEIETEDTPEEPTEVKKPVVIADEEVALTADKPPISAADTPYGKTDEGYAFRLPQPKFVKRANEDASEKLDEAFKETSETFQMIAGKVDELEAEIDLTDHNIRSKDWRLEADLTSEKKKPDWQTQSKATHDKKEAEKRALAEQYKKMDEERRQRDTAHMEKMRAEREALEAKMRSDREDRQAKLKAEMEATQAKLKAERDAKRAEREAYEAQLRGITPPSPAASKPAPPLPAAKPAATSKSEKPEDKEERALRNLSKPDSEPGENKPE